MSFFKKLFGRKSTPESQVTQQEEEVVVTPSVKANDDTKDVEEKTNIVQQELLVEKQEEVITQPVVEDNVAVEVLEEVVSDEVTDGVSEEVVSDEVTHSLWRFARLRILR